MGLTIAKLAAETRSFIWRYLDEDVAITYRPGVLTLAWANGTPVQVALSQTLVSIDVLDEKGKPIATDVDTLSATIPVPVMTKINQAIHDDAGVDPTTPPDSGGG